MTTTRRIPLKINDQIELLKAVRTSIACPCFRNDLKITELSMYLPEGRRRGYKGKPILPTLVLQTDSSLCLNIRGEVIHHPQKHTTYFTVTSQKIYKKCLDRSVVSSGRRKSMNCKDFKYSIGEPNERLLWLMEQLLTHKRR